MNQPNEDQKQPDNMELLKQQASACGSGCGCHTPNASTKTRWVIGAVVLVAAGALVVRAIINNNAASARLPTPAFATVPAAPSPALVAPAPAVPVMQAAVSKSSPSDSPSGPVTKEETLVGTNIGGFSELNTVAALTDVVFIFLPGKDAASAIPPWAPMQAAARTIQSKARFKCGLFTLKPDSTDYSRLSAQVLLPGILVMVKGGGMSAITGDITEEKLIQGFVAASSAGGCGSGGCGSGGCN